MNQPDRILDMDELKKGLQRVGLSLTESELNELDFGHIISLEKMDLGTIGSLFILASAASALNLGKSKRSIVFQDLPKMTQDYQGCSGIPIYCWSSDFAGKRCLYLTVVEGKPAVRVCCNVRLEICNGSLEQGLSAPPIILKS